MAAGTSRVATFGALLGTIGVGDQGHIALARADSADRQCEIAIWPALMATSVATAPRIALREWLASVLPSRYAD
jgi:hypothetical protein